MAQKAELRLRSSSELPALLQTEKVGRQARLRKDNSVCPVCGSESGGRHTRIDNQSFAFLVKLSQENTLQAFLQIARVHIYDIMKMGAPGAAALTKAVSSLQEELHQVTAQGFEGLTAQLTEKFHQALIELGFPEPEQMKLLGQFMPTVVDLMRQLIQLETVPTEKGREGEKASLDQLTSYFPDDEILPLGGSGETDIVAKPSYEGQSLGVEVLVESKRNNQSGWRRSYVEEVRRHMSNHNTKYAILAVEVMPRGTNGYMTEYHSEGVIFVTGRDACHVAYGAVRAVLIATGRLSKRTIDLANALSDKRVTEKIQGLYKFEEFHRQIRKNAASVVTAGKKITEDVDEASEFLRHSLGELQGVILEAVNGESIDPP